MKPGIYTIEQARYLADPCDVPSLSSGIAHLLCSESPAHAKEAHPRLNPNYVEKEAAHFDIGTAAHSILLEGVDVVEVILGFDDWKKKEAQQKRDDARQRGKVPLLEKDAKHVVAMMLACRGQLNEHEDGRLMFTDGRPEQVLVWQDDHDVWCRARLDWLRHGAVDDFKTTGGSANPEFLSRAIYDKGWDVQAAFYLRGLRKVAENDAVLATVIGRDLVFRFAVQETYPPYALSVISLGPSAMVLAEKKVLYALELWSHCLHADDWPAYPTQTCYAELPPYIENAWLRKEEATGAF